MIRACTDADVQAINEIINVAAAAYKGVIPPDCWHEPYMKRSELLNEIANGVNFSGWVETGILSGVMGLQDVQEVTLIRHAYVHPSHQSRGVGSVLLKHLISQTS
jgi:N-acetylglutamate synthase-like GNAT family acetyltransferase